MNTFILFGITLAYSVCSVILIIPFQSQMIDSSLVVIQINGNKLL